MEWFSYLILLLCPLMMIFCLRGHGGHSAKHKDSHERKIDSEILNLQEENAKLRKEVDDLTAVLKK